MSSAQALALACALLANAAGAAVAQQPPGPPPPNERVLRPRPFDRGVVNLGLSMGLATGGGTSFTLGGAFGYFVLDGLEPGLALDVTFGSDQPTVTALLPYLRWVIWRSYSVSPYVKVQGGRLFIGEGFDDLWTAGGGGGLVLFLNRRVGLQLEALVYRLFPGDVCGDDCTDVQVGLTFGVYFGGRQPAPRRPPPPPPPPPPPAPPAPADDEPSPADEPGAPGRDEPTS